MAHRIALLFLLCSASLMALGGEVFKWVDENGKVHYGESVPERYKRNAKKVDLTDVEGSSAQQEEAKARAARDKARAESLQRARERQADAPQPATALPAEVPMAGDECEEQMRKYLESQDCFAPYVNANGGGIKPEAFQHCTEIKQPRGCFPKSGPSDRTYIAPAP
jgi:hypothetical protein